jgi:hypothetical protein
MNRLWLVVILSLILITPSNSLTSDKPRDVNIPSALPDSAGSHIYGKNIAQEIYYQFSSSVIESLVKKITENGSRYVQQLGDVDVGANKYLRNYIIQELNQRSNGKMEIETIGNYKNVVGKLPGYLPGEHPVFVISAHYDSVQDSSGANSDGVGIAVMLELAQVLSYYEWPLDIYFIAFNAVYLFDLLSESYISVMRGSQEVAQEFANRGIDILTLYNIDSILVPDLALPQDEQIQIGYLEGSAADYHKGQYWADLTRAISRDYGMDAFIPVPSSAFYLWQSSDQYPFITRGYTNMLCAFESGHAVDGNYLKPTDRWNNVEYSYSLAMETGATIGASLAYTMSRRYGEPMTLEFDDTLSSRRSSYYYIPITTATIVNISARWFGGPASFYLIDPNQNVIASIEYNHTSAWFLTDIFSIPVTSKGLYKLVVENNNDNPIGYQISMTYESDIDGNHVADSQEYWLAQSYFTSDQDNDGLSDAEEIFLSTNMTLADTDGDIMDDKYEVDWGFDPTNPADGNLDADSDGLTNAQEYTAGLNPRSEDTDNDSMPDLWELQNGLNPLVNDAGLDLDGDGKSNLQEYLDGTNPQAFDFNTLQIAMIASPLIVITLMAVFLYIRRMRSDE